MQLMMTNQNARRIRLIIWVKILPKVKETKAQKGHRHQVSYTGLLNVFLHPFFPL